MSKVSKMELKYKKPVEELLKANRITDKTETNYTHVSLGGISYRGSYNFNDKTKRKELNKLLAKAADNGVHFSIAERCKDYGPLKVDIDLEIPIEDSEELMNDKHIYNEELVHNVIRHYHNAIRKFCNVNDNELKCILFEREECRVKNEDTYRDGIHLIFPDINLHYKTRLLITNEVAKTTEDEELFINYTSVDPVDTGIVNSHPWLMYGNCKPQCKPYKMSAFLDYKMNEIVGFFKNTAELVNYISLRSSKYKESKSTKLNNDFDNDMISETFSEIGGGSKTEQKEITQLPEASQEQIEQAIELTRMLTKTRSNGYNSWLRVGWALHNIHDTLLDTWIEFSKMSKKYKEGECNKLWENMKRREGGLTIRSLMSWAKEDNPDDYSKFTKTYFRNIIQRTSECNSYNIASALKYKYNDRFVCSSLRDDEWYEYFDHRWHRRHRGGTLITLMSTDFSNYYIKLQQERLDQSTRVSDTQKKILMEEANQYGLIAKKLLDITFKEKILKEAKYIFYDSEFKEKLDEQYHLIGFKNGVYDLEMKNFRPGHPDDHITLSTNLHYTRYNPNNIFAKKLMAFLQQVLPIEEVRKYFIMKLSSTVSGEMNEEKIYFCLGSGGNGKSKLFKLVKMALGEYYITCPISLLTKKRGASNAASPEMARMKGPRCGVYQEPGTDETINVGIFKELSGGDSMLVRGLFQEPIEITPQTKQFIIMNELPVIPSADDGTWRRIERIDFPSKFTTQSAIDDMKKKGIDTSYCFVGDQNLDKKLIQWAPTFISYLIHIYNTEYNVEDRMKTPELVKAGTNEYRNDQDRVSEFFQVAVELTHLKEDYVQKRVLYAHYKAWMGHHNDGEKVEKNKKIYDFVESKWGIKYGRSYRGIKLLPIQDEETKQEQSSDNEEEDDDTTEALETDI
jgi:P4 family phage/plasmid primase-like protien